MLNNYGFTSFVSNDKFCGAGVWVGMILILSTAGPVAK